MLLQLHIQQYAIIDDLHINFTPGLTIITGETGAGKSIVMGALGLVLGDRADSTVLSGTDKKSIVEAHFSTRNPSVQEFLALHEFDAADELIVRREIAANGKSRAFVNDTPVNLAQLKVLATLLADLHQQFDTLELGELDFQREILDALADNTALLATHAAHYKNYYQCRQELDALLAEQAHANKEADYNRFLFDELDAAALKENELEDLDAELKLLSNAENIKQGLSAISAVLDEGEQPMVQEMKMLVNKLRSFEQYHSNIPLLVQRLEGLQVELKDVAAELEHCNNSIQYHPRRMQEVSDKIAVGYKLLKKHGVTTTAELLGIRESLEQKLDAIVNLSHQIAAKEKEVAGLMKSCEKTAATLHSRRSAAAAPFAAQVDMLLTRIGMPNARLKVALESTALHITGTDQVQFLFDGNKSNRFEPLGRVASGGELSRLMLCIKSLVARQVQLPTLIFDEIDTGISGEAARQAGQIMKELSDGHQVIAITHQPQIAARADTHYFVYKEDKGGKLVTGIRLLTNEERITTIAQMLGGEQPTAAALENAREMVNN